MGPRANRTIECRAEKRRGRNNNRHSGLNHANDGDGHKVVGHVGEVKSEDAMQSDHGKCNGSNLTLAAIIAMLKGGLTLNPRQTCRQWRLYKLFSIQDPRASWQEVK